MVFPIFTVGDDARDQLKFSGERQLTALVEWARQIPHFLDLPLGDQVTTILHSLGDPDPEQDLGLPDPYPLVRGTHPDPDPSLFS
jgi:hypothetical protein